ncbi:conserved hypothetical protein [Candidatus Roizmanbacteria bacterium]|nr:conserved hypothetical protein [Candidatus Roizmanbacteria bacterium]
MDINSIGPNIFFDFFKLSIKINRLPKNPRRAYKITDGLFLRRITLTKPLIDNNNQIIRL